MKNLDKYLTLLDGDVDGLLLTSRYSRHYGAWNSTSPRASPSSQRRAAATSLTAATSSPPKRT